MSSSESVSPDSDESFPEEIDTDKELLDHIDERPDIEPCLSSYSSGGELSPNDLRFQ
jgi:hypothetical protein